MCKIFGYIGQDRSSAFCPAAIPPGVPGLRQCGRRILSRPADPAITQAGDYLARLGTRMPGMVDRKMFRAALAASQNLPELTEDLLTR